MNNIYLILYYSYIKAQANISGVPYIYYCFNDYIYNISNPDEFPVYYNSTFRELEEMTEIITMKQFFELLFYLFTFGYLNMMNPTSPRYNIYQHEYYPFTLNIYISVLENF